MSGPAEYPVPCYESYERQQHAYAAWRPGIAIQPTTRPGPQGPALLAAVLIVAGSVVLGLAGGADLGGSRAASAYQVATLHPPTAYATNPETSAFIAADGWYCVIALAGGALIGLLGYLFAVRRYGPVRWPRSSLARSERPSSPPGSGTSSPAGLGFDHVLATSKPGALLYAPISLGSHGALAFWPLAAAAVAGGIELVGVLKDRRQEPYGCLPMPGIESFGSRPFPKPGYLGGQFRSAGGPVSPVTQASPVPASPVLVRTPLRSARTPTAPVAGTAGSGPGGGR